MGPHLLRRDPARPESMEAIPNQRAIVDRRDLAPALDAVAGERLDPAAERARLLAELKHALAAGRAEIRRRFDPGAGEHLAIVAVGGYGRGELAPHSDVDLLFLLPYKLTPYCEQVVEYLLYPLFYLCLKLRHP